MNISQIKALAFRNYDQINYQAVEGLNLFVGMNGAGKTNFLDLVHYLATGRSYFTGLDREVVKEGSDIMRLETKVGIDTELKKLVIKWQRRGGKSLEWDGVELERMSEHIGRLKVVMMAPQDAFVLQLGNTERRRWLDRLLCQYQQDYARNLQTYHRVLQRRNAYLKETAPHLIDDALLQIYWEQMREPAEMIHDARVSAIDVINKMTNEAYLMLASGQETVGLSLYSDLDKNDWKKLHGIRDDILNKSTQRGIHKDKLAFTIGDKKLKTMGSQGQTKSFFLALKFAELEMLSSGDTKPILLIDDVFSKLDETRVNQLFHLLDQKGLKQVFVSDTHFDRMKNLLRSVKMGGQITEVQQGVLNLLYEEEE